MFKTLLPAFLILFSLNSEAAACGREKSTVRDGEFEVKVSKYRSNRGSDRAIVIFPPTGGINLIDKSYARRFCLNGFDVYILENWTGDDYESDELELHQRFYGLSAKAMGALLKTIDHRYVGVLGTSVGALFATVSAGTYARLDAAMSIVGGSTIPEVVVTSDQKAMVDLKARRYRRFGFKSDAEYLRALDGAFSLDPTELPRHFQKMDLGVVIATKDETVRTKTQNALRDFWKPSKIIEINSGHFWGIVNSWLFHSREITRFFKASAAKKLDAK